MMCFLRIVDEKRGLGDELSFFAEEDGAEEGEHDEDDEAAGGDVEIKGGDESGRDGEEGKDFGEK